MTIRTPDAKTTPIAQKGTREMVSENRTRINRLFMKGSLVVLLSVVSSCLPAAAANANDNGIAKAQVAKEDGRWSIRGAVNRLQFNPCDLQMTMGTKDRTWIIRTDGTGLTNVPLRTMEHGDQRPRILQPG